MLGLSKDVCVLKAVCVLNSWTRGCVKAGATATAAAAAAAAAHLSHKLLFLPLLSFFFLLLFTVVSLSSELTMVIYDITLS